MLALTIIQPFAWAIAHGQQTTYARPLYTSHRLPILLYASPSPGDPREFDWIKGCPPPRSREMPYGAIVGVADLIDCVEGAPGSRAWLYLFSDPVAIPPIPCRGLADLWPVPPATLRRVEYSHPELAARLAPLTLDRPDSTMRRFI